jgi:DNA-binding transcriptional ArsR family regulator
MSDVDALLPPPGYPLDAEVVADTPERLKALADPTRQLILDLVLEQAYSVTELATRVGRSKGTVAHHVDTLVAAGLAKVVRTRRVRAVEERFYGRVARTIVYPRIDGNDPLHMLTDARNECDLARYEADDVGGLTLRHARIPAERAAEFWGRVAELAVAFTALERGGDVEYAFLAGVFPTHRLPSAADMESPR